MWNRARVIAESGPRPTRSVYRIRRGYFVRAFGRTAVVAAAGVLATTLCMSLSAPGWLSTLLVVLTTVALVVVGLIAVSVMLPPTLLQLDQHGFRASRRYTSGPRQGMWGDVQNAASQQGPEGWVLLLQHHNGEHTAVPLALVDADSASVEKDVRARLDDAHGYGPLR